MSRRITARDLSTIRASVADQSIVLVGLMGAGKTTVGRRLAERLGLPFIDADLEIERAAGKTIPEIFADHGEVYFRDGERRVISRLLDSGPQVLATGGGAFMNPETRKLIARRGLSVWLRADLPLLMKRVRRRSNRPLLDTTDPEAVMRQLIDERYPVYAEAAITIDSRDLSHNVIVNDLLQAILEHYSRKGRTTGRTAESGEHMC
jgi:shikimate kinase